RGFYEYHTRLPLEWVMRALARDARPAGATGRYPRDAMVSLLRRYRAGCPPGAFRRESSVGRPDVRLYRLGDPSTDAIADNMHGDDGGRVFAVWRHVPGRLGVPAVVFRFDYQVTADVTAAREFLAGGRAAISPQSQQRLGDALLPPQAET